MPAARFTWFDDEQSVDQHRKTATYRNLGLGVLHFALLATFIGIWAGRGVSDFYTTRTTAFVWKSNATSTGIVQLSDPKLETCVDIPKAYNASWNSKTGWGYQPVAVNSFFFSKALFIIAFIGITCAAHFVRAGMIMQASSFFDTINEGRPRWDRWLEYSLSSPLMLIVIAGTTGVSDVWTLALLGVSQFTLCFYGYAIELLDWTLDNEKLVMEKTSSFNAAMMSMFPSITSSYGRNDPPYYKKNMPVKLNLPWAMKRVGTNLPQYSQYPDGSQEAPYSLYDSPPDPTADVIVDPEKEPLASPYNIIKVMRNAKILIFLNGMYTFFFQWFCIIANFMQMSDGFNCINKPEYLSSLTRSIPELIIASEFILFICFPFLQLYLNFYKGTSMAKNYGWKSEFLYGWLSVLSKATLTTLLIIQAYVQQFNK